MNHDKLVYDRKAAPNTLDIWDILLDTSKIFSELTEVTDTELEGLGVEDVKEFREDWQMNSADKLSELLESVNGEPYTVVNDNTSNYEEQLDNCMDYSIIHKTSESDFFWSNGVYVTCAVNGGGDPRGGYGDNKVYRTHSLGDEMMYDFVIGWAVYETDKLIGNTPNTPYFLTALKDYELLSTEALQEYEVGYHSHPTYRLEEDFEYITYVGDGTFMGVQKDPNSPNGYNRIYVMYPEAR